MKHRILLLLLVSFLALFTSCNQNPKETKPEPTLEIVNLQITPELEHWMPKISQCANSIEGVGIYTDIVTQSELNINQTDLVLRLGQRGENDPHIAVMGFEEITLVAGSEVPVDTLGIETVIKIFSGELTNWGDVPEVRAQEIDINQPIQILSYPKGNILYDLFSHNFLESEPIKGDPIIYSTPEGLDRLLQKNPYGVAYLLTSHLLGNQKILNISDLEPSFVQEYVLAITNSEPKGKIKQLLLCLQDS